MKRVKRLKSWVEVQNKYTERPVNQLERPMLRLSAGNDGWGRVFGAASPRVAGGYLLGALEVNHNDGPWARPDDSRKINGVLRYSRGDNRNGFSFTGMGLLG